MKKRSFADPCTPRGYPLGQEAELSDGLQNSESGHDTGNCSVCRSAAVMVFHEGKDRCSYKNCNIGSIFVPELRGRFLTTEKLFYTSKTDGLMRLLPLVGSSNISTACLLGITGVLAMVLEETVFRGFLLVALTNWFPTPVCVVISAALFAIAHLTPGEFPQPFVLGCALGFSYGQTRNLMTPITIHAFWNSGVILLLTFLQLQGYDIRELLQGS